MANCLDLVNRVLTVYLVYAVANLYSYEFYRRFFPRHAAAKSSRQQDSFAAEGETWPTLRFAHANLQRLCQPPWLRRRAPEGAPRIEGP